MPHSSRSFKSHSNLTQPFVAQVQELELKLAKLAKDLKAAQHPGRGDVPAKASSPVPDPLQPEARRELRRSQTSRHDRRESEVSGLDGSEVAENSDYLDIASSGAASTSSVEQSTPSKSHATKSQACTLQTRPFFEHFL